MSPTQNKNKNILFNCTGCPIGTYVLDIICLLYNKHMHNKLYLPKSSILKSSPYQFIIEKCFWIHFDLYLSLMSLLHQSCGIQKILVKNSQNFLNNWTWPLTLSVLFDYLILLSNRLNWGLNEESVRVMSKIIWNIWNPFWWVSK